MVGNQLTWINVRPGETRSCLGCHERPDTAAPPGAPTLALRTPPVPCLPSPDAFSYRAKAWFNGTLPSAIEERTRTVCAVNLMAQ